MASFKYRPEIDGLRAVAVLAVLFYHLAASKLSGGYIGVDIFFVISGFLITSLIWKDLESGKFSFAHFWERRARRIVPALAVVTLFSLFVGFFILFPSDLKELGRAAASQATFTANIHYWQSLDYFGGKGDTIPLLHTWSLAVEEQFYLFVPFLFWFLYRFQILRNRNAVFALLLCGFAVSFAASVYSVSYYPKAAFYLLPARAWELLLGSLIAFSPNISPFLSERKYRDPFSIIGFICVCAPMFLYDGLTPFPGYAALLPCFGTAMIIWSSGYGKTIIGSLLSVRPMVFIGLISYSLYLWHWPLIVYHRYVLITWSAPWTRRFFYLIILAEAFALAILSWKFVESPFRERKLGSSRKSMYAYAGAGLFVLLALGSTFFLANGLPDRFSKQTVMYANAPLDRQYKTLCKEDLQTENFMRVGIDDPTATPHVFIWGDSFGGSALPAIDDYLKGRGLVGQVAIYGGTLPLLDYYVSTPWGLNEQAPHYNEAIFSYIKDKKIPNVLMVASWKMYCQNHKSATGKAFRSAFLATVQRFTSNDIQVTVLLEPPRVAFNVPRFLALTTHFGTDLTPYLGKVESWDQMTALPPDFIAKLEAIGVQILDPRPAFVDKAGKHFVVQEEGIPLYWDGCHLTDSGSRRKLLPLFRKSFHLETSPLITTSKMRGENPKSNPKSPRSKSIRR